MPKQITQETLFDIATPDPAASEYADPYADHETAPIECWSFHERRILPWLSRDMTLADLAYNRIHYRNCAVEFRPATTSVRKYVLKRLDENSDVPGQ